MSYDETNYFVSFVAVQFIFEGAFDCMSPQTNATLAAHDVMDAVVSTDGHFTRCWDGWGHRAMALRKVE